ncbi:pyridoxal phosphate-dependent aminotransferase [Jannaschia faecimaris]|nr:pyridoxal phosphate-dependent aminotransferase [Jannaschia faecimaris]
MSMTSTRVRSIAQTRDGWAIYSAARALRDAGAAVIDMTVGQHDTGTNPVILDALAASARAGHTGYAPLTGTPALRDAIAARVQARTGVTTTRDNVALTMGGQFALFATCMTIADPGAHVLFPDPFYTSNPATARAAGLVPVPVRARPEDGFQPRAADLARTRDLWLISDEVYDAQVWTGPHLSPRALPDMAARRLVVGSMSKGHAMTGSRLGWLVGPVDAIAGAADLCNTTTYGPPGYIQGAALHALALGDAFEARIAAPFRHRRDACLARLARQQTVGVIPSGGAMYLILDVRACGMTGTAFARALLDRHRIAVMPGESFGEAATGHVRLALTRPGDELLIALDTLLTFAKETTT